MRYFFYFLILFLFASCKQEVIIEEVRKLSIKCDAETIKGDHFISGEHVLKGVKSRSSEKSRSGKCSVKLNDASPYGFTYSISDVKKGDIIEASVWKHNGSESGGLVITSDDPNFTQYDFNTSIRIKEGEWGQIQSFFVAQHDYKKVLVYALNMEETVCYFDDIAIDGYFNNSMPSDSYEALEISIDQSALDTLEKCREIAVKQGVITSELKNYVAGELTIQGKKVPISLRLKGDWTDHLESNKWSFRIKMKDDAYKGMKSFSIQNPSTRSFMLEWFAHKLFEKEDVLTTRYLFIPVIINGKTKGVYALEEHFDKQLLEFRKRREGPIVKFDESGIWQLHYLEHNEHKYYNLPVLASAEVVPFKSNRTFKTETLFKQFFVAKGQMERYRDHDEDVDDYFDVESLAKFIALSDIINGKHGSIWHNQRNYFNPVTNKLEPIAYDCFMSPNHINTDIGIEGLNRRLKKNFTLIESTLSNEKVEEAYFTYLKKFSDKKYLEKVFVEMSKEIAEAEKLLNYEYPNIKFDKEFFQKNCKEVRDQLVDYEKVRANPITEGEAEPFDILPENVIFTDIALKANIESIDANGITTVSLRNFHSASIEVFGYSTKKDKKIVVPISTVILKGIVNKPDVVILKFKEKPRRILYRAANCGDKKFKAGLEDWGIAKKPKFFNSEANTLTSEKGSNKIVLSGKLNLSKDLFIPRGKKLIIKAGTEIKLTNNASIVSNSPVDLRGTKELPVKISSPDGTANGFVVLSSETSKMTYTTFSNMNTMNKFNWTLTGAVTFYGGNVTIENCEFLGNKCEDGLNLIRCHFGIRNSKVADAYSDGFDADFCTGNLSNSHFENTGNDCIDFSGSKISIESCTILNAGDKGISGGEDSELLVKNCIIKGAYIAIASKDFSLVTVSNVNITNSVYGFAAYRKKPEYGGSKIVVNSVQYMGAKNLSLLEKGSSLRYLKKMHVGFRQFNIDSMYMAFTK